MRCEERFPYIQLIFVILSIDMCSLNVCILIYQGDIFSSLMKNALVVTAKFGFRS